MVEVEHVGNSAPLEGFMFKGTGSGRDGEATDSDCRCSIMNWRNSGGCNSFRVLGPGPSMPCHHKYVGCCWSNLYIGKI